MQESNTLAITSGLIVASLLLVGCTLTLGALVSQTGAAV
jgi:hypothetical protein